MRVETHSTTEHDACVEADMRNALLSKLAASHSSMGFPKAWPTPVRVWSPLPQEHYAASKPQTNLSPPLANPAQTAHHTHMHS